MRQLSIWEKESFFDRQDVIIIGSGFAGLWSALHLKLSHPDYKVTVLERGLIPNGASTRNAGFSCFGSPSELISDAHMMGEDDMWKLVTMRYEGLQKIRGFFNDEEIGYDANGGYECFTTASEDWKECEQKLTWLNDGLKRITGEENIFSIADKKLAGFGFSEFGHMIENKLEAGLHPGKLVQALLKRIYSLGVQVITGIEVVSYAENDNLVTVSTDQQIDFTTRQLLLCTNAFTKQLVPAIDIIPNRGQVLVTSNIGHLPFKGTFHFDRGFYYFRNLGNRLLLGGARHKAFEAENTTDMQTTDTIQQELEQFIRRYLLPRTNFSITDRWTGIMAMGTEKSPIVKAISQNVFCCVRMSGMGVALAPVVARQVVDLMSK
ncbi:MAG: FAD-dependent oxidoreductase [Ferruginibacter sp.]